MKTIVIKDDQHAQIKEYARKNGLKLEFVTELMVSKFLESLNEKREPKPEIKQPETVETIELTPAVIPENVVKPEKKESATKGMCLFVNSPYFDIDLLTEKICEQSRFHRFMPIDIQKLYDTIYSWSESNFEKRKDWLSVAFTFLTKAKGNEFKPTINGTFTKRDAEIVNWMKS